ncbi:hypothetical protein [Aneurinibacillus tyrosinisolvens]|uniref:hypothetical protein n=1 Tax=Aneurinibacillus tyrosinisolvens TaxID=1443435 RepID=UPI00063F9BDE|nr:hypothetical protein [Aneurinibacillus tyrosinisolvens]
MLQADENNQKPTVTDLNQLDIAILLEKQILVLGKLRNGTPEEKVQAQKEAEELQEAIRGHVNSAAFVEARKRLGLPAETDPNSISFLEKEE